MNIRSFAHLTQARLKTVTGLDVKRTHIYELMASAVGIGSHAALTTEGLLCPLPSRPLIAHYGALNTDQCTLRAAVLGYPKEQCEPLATALCSEMASQPLGLVPFEDILNVLLTGSRALYMEEVRDAAYHDARDAAFEQAMHSRESADAWLDDSHEFDDPEPLRLNTPWIIHALQIAAAHGEGRAHLALGLLCLASTVNADPELDEFDDFDELDDLPDSRAGQYWYERQQKGEALMGVELEWAQSFASRMERGETTEMERTTKLVSASDHFNAAAELGQHDGLLILADLHGDDRFFDIEEPHVRADPLWIADLADRVGRYEWAQAWTTLAAEHGDTQAMRYLVEHAHRQDPLKAWTWFHLAKLLGTDLTRDQHWAVHEDGSHYDDNVGGAMFAAGIDGVELPEAQDLIKRHAESLAQSLHAQLVSR